MTRQPKKKAESTIYRINLFNIPKAPLIKVALVSTFTTGFIRVLFRELLLVFFFFSFSSSLCSL